MATRWWTYQRERFPVFAHGSLIAAFSFSAVSYSASLLTTNRTDHKQLAPGGLIEKQRDLFRAHALPHPCAFPLV